MHPSQIKTIEIMNIFFLTRIFTETLTDQFKNIGTVKWFVKIVRTGREVESPRGLPQVRAEQQKRLLFFAQALA